MKQQILFLLPAFAIGGAELNLLRLLKSLSKSGNFELAVAVFRKNSMFHNELPDNVRLYDLSGTFKWNFFAHILRLTFLLQKIRPATVISYFLYCNACLAVAKSLSGTDAKTVFSVRLSPWHGERKEKLKWFRLMILKLLYSKTDMILVNAQEMRYELTKRFSVPDNVIHVIPNSVDFKRVQAEKNTNISHPFFTEPPVIISVGRLVRQKGFDILLQAVAILKDIAQFKVIIIGDGPEKDALQKLITGLKIASMVDIVGSQLTPYPWLHRADIFVLASRYEGLPNAIMDAMACGLPVIATECPTGPQELIQDQINGILVPVEDARALAWAMRQLVNDSNMRNNLGAKAGESIKKYALENIAKQYEYFLQGACQSSGKGS